MLCYVSCSDERRVAGSAGGGGGGLLVEIDEGQSAGQSETGRSAGRLFEQAAVVVDARRAEVNAAAPLLLTLAQRLALLQFIDERHAQRRLDVRRPEIQLATRRRFPRATWKNETSRNLGRDNCAAFVKSNDTRKENAVSIAPAGFRGECMCTYTISVYRYQVFNLKKYFGLSDQ